MKEQQFWQELFGADFLRQLCTSREEVAEYFRGMACAATQDVRHNMERDARRGAACGMERDAKYHVACDAKREEARREIYVCDVQASHFVKRFLEKTTPAFEKFYEPYIQAGYEMVKTSVACMDICTESFMEDYLKKLLSELGNLGIRVLLKEMHEMHEKDEREGATISDASRTDSPNAADTDYYDVFCECHLEKAAYREYILKRYPVLECALSDCVHRNAQFYVELLQRVSKDKEQIQDVILRGRTFRHLSGIDDAGGDAHFSGKRVLKLRLDTGDELIYKPHGIKNERVFYEIVYDFGLACGTDMYVPALLERDGYGWVECVKAKPCRQQEELRRYYYRMGVQLFVAYLLGTHDVHCENLIARGEYPVVVDLENLMFGEKGDVHQAKNQDGMNGSVLASGILPYGYWQLHGKCVDLSAISGGEQEIPLRVPVIKEACTQNMHVGYRYARIGKTSNKAALNHNEAAPSQYEKELRQGFEIAYWYSMAFKKEVRQTLAALEEVTCRHLVCDTQKYSLLLGSSYHPSVMEDAADRALLLHVLWRGKRFENEMDGQIVDAEIHDLLQNDIPFFYFRSNQTSLFDSRHREIKGYFARSPFKDIHDRLEHLNVSDLKRQMELMHLSLHADGWELPAKAMGEDEEAFGHDLGRMLERPSDYSTREKAAMAEKIADRLLRQSWEDERGLHWNCLLVSGQEKALVRLYPCGMYLYDGIAGYTIFLHMLATYGASGAKRPPLCGTPDTHCPEWDVRTKKYDAACDTLARQMFHYTDRGMEDVSNLQTGQSGLYNGEGSLVYAYLVLYRLHGKEVYLEYAGKHARLLVELAEKDDSNDLLDGKAGAVYALCALYQASGEEWVLRAAEKIGGLLIARAVHMEYGIGWENSEKSTVLAGMAHGNAGILVALAKLYELTKGQSLYEAMRRALRWEHEQFDEMTEDWKDYRKLAAVQKAGHGQVSAWCHGAGGILLSRILISKVQWEESERAMIAKDIERAESYLSKHMSRNERCLCHGACGNRLIMRLWKGKVGFDEERENGKILTKEWFNPSLMNGYAGIGYYLLSELEGFVDYVFLEGGNEQ